MIELVKDYISQVQASKIVLDLNKMSTNDHMHYVGPYKLEKTLGKGQTGQFFVLLQYWITVYYSYCILFDLWNLLKKIFVSNFKVFFWFYRFFNHF